jgi:hypothetical protein
MEMPMEWLWSSKEGSRWKTCRAASNSPASTYAFAMTLNVTTSGVTPGRSTGMAVNACSAR